MGWEESLSLWQRLLVGTEGKMRKGRKKMLFVSSGGWGWLCVKNKHFSKKGILGLCLNKDQPLLPLSLSPSIVGCRKGPWGEYKGLSLEMGLGWCLKELGKGITVLQILVVQAYHWKTRNWISCKWSFVNSSINNGTDFGNGAHWPLRNRRFSNGIEIRRKKIT